MGLWAKGLHAAKVHRLIGDGLVGATVNGRLATVKRSEVREYLDHRFWGMFDVWHRWRMYQALPFGGGWAEQPAYVVEIIDAAEAGYLENKK